MTAPRPSLRVGTFIAQRYEIDKLINQGGFGEVYLGFDHHENKQVAIKVELKCTSVGVSQLVNEYEVYTQLETNLNGNLFPKAYEFIVHETRNLIVLDLLGPSVSELLVQCGGKFSMKTILMFIDQALDQLEFLHKQGFVHGDVKPENFVTGQKGSEVENKLYLIDFGLVAKYVEPSTGNHVPKKGVLKPIRTVQYCSMNAHKGLTQGRKDYLESLGYVLFYFCRQGTPLPWQGLVATNQKMKNRMVMDLKRMNKPQFMFRGQPYQFQHFMSTVLALKFDQEPPYQQLKESFRNLGTELGIEYDWDWDWDHIDEEQGGEQGLLQLVKKPELQTARKSNDDEDEDDPQFKFQLHFRQKFWGGC